MRGVEGISPDQQGLESTQKQRHGRHALPDLELLRRLKNENTAAAKICGQVTQSVFLRFPTIALIHSHGLRNFSRAISRLYVKISQVCRG